MESLAILAKQLGKSVEEDTAEIEASCEAIETAAKTKARQKREEEQPHKPHLKLALTKSKKQEAQLKPGFFLWLQHAPGGLSSRSGYGRIASKTKATRGSTAHQLLGCSSRFQSKSAATKVGLLFNSLKVGSPCPPNVGRVASTILL